MENESGNIFTPLSPGAEKLQPFFIQHLNMLYCAKAHIIERLPDIAEANFFRSIKAVVNDAIEQAEAQVEKMDQIYKIFNTRYSFEHLTGLVNFLERSFTNSQWNMSDPDLGIIMIISYLDFIECLEASCVHLLKLLALKLQNEKLSQLLKEGFVKVDKVLAAQLTDLYTETVHV